MYRDAKSGRAYSWKRRWEPTSFGRWDRKCVPCYYTNYASDTWWLVFMESAPVVIVFTKYDRLVRLKRDQLQEDGYDLSEDALHEKSNAEAQKALDVCIQSLESTLSGMQIPKLQTPKPRYVTVSGINLPLFIWSALICLPRQTGLRR